MVAVLCKGLNMKKYSKVSMIFAAVALATSASAQDETSIDGEGNWRNGTNELVWKNGTNELCWRNSGWTPANAAPGCDGALMVPASVLAPVASYTPPAPLPAPVVVPPAVKVPEAVNKMTYSADTFFDFDKSFLKPAGKSKLNLLLAQVHHMRLDVVIVVGHTDSVGSDAYNEELSMRRSEAVRAYLVSNGVDGSRISTEGMGERQPVANNTTREGRALNRRVEIEVVGIEMR